MKNKNIKFISKLRFGLFGVKLEKPTYPTLNYIGTALTVLSIITFFFVKTVDTSTMNKKSSDYDDDDYDDPLVINSEKIITKSRIILWLETFSEKSKKFMGIGLAIFSGILFGKF